MSCALQVQVKAGVSDEEIAGYQRYVESTIPKQRKEFFQTRDVMYITVESVTGRPSAGIIAGDAGAAIQIRLAGCLDLNRKLHHVRRAIHILYREPNICEGMACKSVT